MARNYYEVLGLPKNASEKDIQKAYRELARKYHPDLHPDDKDASKKFSEVQEAYDTLNNKDKRKQYDQFGENYEQFQGMPGGGGFGGFGGFGGPGGQEFDLNDILGRYAKGGFGGGRRGGGGFGGFDFGGMFGGGRGRQNANVGGEDVMSEITIPFSIAINGGKQPLSYVLPNGQSRNIEINIPAGISDGKKMRLKGQGTPSLMGGAPGDLVITVHVMPHPYFTRQGNDLVISLPITLGEAINGGKVDVPTPKGTVALTIPAGTSSGKRLRMKGFGVPSNHGPAGDLYVEPKIILPDKITDELANLAEKAEAGYRHNPRIDMRW